MVEEGKNQPLRLIRFEDLQLWLWGLERRNEFPLDRFVFMNSCFTDLELSGCILNPTGAISWKNLRSLRISWVKLDECLIENILSGSPVLETLELNNCYGFERLNINSKSDKMLVFSGYMNMNIHNGDISDTIKINAPNIWSLKIQDHLRLRNLSLLNVSSLVEAHLDYIKVPKKAKEEMLKQFILNLLHVKDLKIGTSCLKVLNRLKAKGFLSPSNLIECP